MGIKKSFAGASIRKPGAYSRSKVDNSGGAPLGTNDTLFLIGEADSGKAGSVEGIVEFTAEQIDRLVEKFTSGPVVDCAIAATRPSPDNTIGGAGRILVYITNAIAQASKSVNEATNTNPLYSVKDRKGGVSGNDLSITIANGTVPARQKLVTINRLNDTAEVLGENPGTAVISIDYTGDATTASAVISGASKAAKTLAITLAGDQTDGSTDQSILLANYTIKQLIDLINAQTGYAAVLLDASKAAILSNELDSIGATSILAVTSLYRLQEEILELINTSDRVEATLAATPVAGLPVNLTSSFLSGGARGASTNSNFSTGLAKSLANDYSVALPCISRDASSDIADGATDAASSYTIAAVQAALSAHLSLRGSVKNRKEAQGHTGFRNSAKSACFAQSAVVGSELVQFHIQDVLVSDVNGNLTWKHPHVHAALCAGIRLGTEVGEPLTHKFLRVNAVGHVVNPITGLETGDFNESLDIDDAIDAGVTFSEKAQGGNRIVVDNTTYGRDQSFVFNRGSVVEAAQFTAKTLRETAELVFVGKKVSNGAASSIKSVLRSKLQELNRNQIITSSDDAPEGFVEETFVVTVNGNTAEVQVEVKPVQGLDFVFITFTLGDIKQSA
jgi:hypothetical protein